MDIVALDLFRSRLPVLWGPAAPRAMRGRGGTEMLNYPSVDTDWHSPSLAPDNNLQLGVVILVSAQEIPA